MTIFHIMGASFLVPLIWLLYKGVTQFGKPAECPNCKEVVKFGKDDDCPECGHKLTEEQMDQIVNDRMGASKLFFEIPPKWFLSLA